MQRILSAILALANDKGAALDAAASDVATAASRVILHGDAALFQSTAAALETRKGSTAKAILGRLLAAQAAAVAGRMTGRKGRPTTEETEAAQAAAAAIAADFRAACVADGEERSAKAKAAQAAAKAKKAAAPAEASTAAPAEASTAAPEVVVGEYVPAAEAEALKAEAEAAKAEAEALRRILAQIKEASNIREVRALLAA